MYHSVAPRVALRDRDQARSAMHPRRMRQSSIHDDALSNRPEQAKRFDNPAAPTGPSWSGEQNEISCVQFASKQPHVRASFRVLLQSSRTHDIEKTQQTWCCR
jgi:hypothetical protein